MSVSFTVTQSHEDHFASNNAVQAPLSTSDLENVQAAKEALEKKQTMIEKLGKFWTVLKFISQAGEAVKDVLVQRIAYQRHTDSLA